MIRAAYLDTSALLAILFRQAASNRVSNVLSSLSQIVSSDLIISETYSACRREGVEVSKAKLWLERINIIHAVIEEDSLASILEIDYLRGADLHHIASALWMFHGVEEQVYFASLDVRQSAVAKKLGFLLMDAD